jgi:hypothetical protein
MCRIHYIFNLFYKTNIIQSGDELVFITAFCYLVFTASLRACERIREKSGVKGSRTRFMGILESMTERWPGDSHCEHNGGVKTRGEKDDSSAAAKSCSY